MKNKKFSFSLPFIPTLAIIFIFLLAMVVSFYQRLHQTDSPPKLIDMLFTQAKPLTSKAVLMEKNQQGVWWVTKDNYNIYIPTKNAILFRSASDIKDNVSENQYKNALNAPKIQQLLELATSEFKQNGFSINQENSSKSIDDSTFYDYIQAFEKNNTKCTVTLNPELTGREPNLDTMYYELSIACTEDFAKAYQEQEPLLKALNMHKTIVSIYKHEGDFYWIDVHERRSGYFVFAKKVGDTYTEIYSGQGYPSCSLMRKNNIPKSFYEKCWDEKLQIDR